EKTTASDRFVCSFKSFHGKHGPVSHDDGLTNIEPADFSRDLETERDVIFFAVAKLPADDQTCGQQTIFEEGSGGKKRDAGARELIADRGENGLGVAAFQSREEQQSFPIRAQ